MRRGRRSALLALVALLVSACVAEPTATPAPSPSVTDAPPPSPTPTSPSTPSEVASPTATPEPPLSLDLPEQTDSRVVAVAVAPEVGAEGGRILVTVTSAADERIDELVLRWPTEVGETLFLAPFVPSEERIREGGNPLVQTWTKWVIGPGEQGEPAGTTSLGYGPLLAGATLEIPIFVTRRAPGPVAFDLQVLAANDLLMLDSGEPAELRVQIP